MLTILKGGIQMDAIYKAKSLLSIEELEELDIPHEHGYVVGSLINDNRFPYIVGRIKRSASAYMQFDWQVPIDRESTSKATGFTDASGDIIFFEDVLMEERIDIDDVSKEIYISLVEVSGLPCMLYLNKCEDYYEPFSKPQILKEWNTNAIKLKTNTKERYY